MKLTMLNLEGSMARDCPICGGVALRSSVHFMFSYYKCINCHTAHLFPQPSERQLQEYYTTFHLPEENGGIFAPFEERTMADFPSKAKIISKFLSTSNLVAAPQVLDVGCGKGFFVRELAKMDIPAQGIDISRRAVAEGAQRFGLNLREGRLEHQSDWEHKFDAVSAFATIEHVTDPMSFLKSAHRVLKTGGYLFLDTGLCDDFVGRHAPGLVQWFDCPQHLFVFGRFGLSKVLDDAGFDAITFDPNFERTLLRKYIKSFRNRSLVLAASFLFRIGLGKPTYQRMKMESKMPFGSLAFVVARAR
jgi:SAM-dependent methyltransferase